MDDSVNVSFFGNKLTSKPQLISGHLYCTIVIMWCQTNVQTTCRR